MLGLDNSTSAYPSIDGLILSDLDKSKIYLIPAPTEFQETLKELGVKLETDRFVGVGGAVQSVPVKEF